MAKKRSYTNVGGGGRSRANWWKRQLGTDPYYYSAGEALLLLEDGGNIQTEDSAGFISLETLLTWLLVSGVWNDAAYWLDNKLWID